MRIAASIVVTAMVLVGCHNHTAQPRLSKAEAMTLAEPSIQRSFPDAYSDYSPYRAQFSGDVWTVRSSRSPRTGKQIVALVRDRDGQVQEVRLEM